MALVDGGERGRVAARRLGAQASTGAGRAARQGTEQRRCGVRGATGHVSANGERGRRSGPNSPGPPSCHPQGTGLRSGGWTAGIRIPSGSSTLTCRHPPAAPRRDAGGHGPHARRDDPARRRLGLHEAVRTPGLGADARAPRSSWRPSAAASARCCASPTRTAAASSSWAAMPCCCSSRASTPCRGHAARRPGCATCCSTWGARGPRSATPSRACRRGSTAASCTSPWWATAPRAARRRLGSDGRHAHGEGGRAARSSSARRRPPCCRRAAAGAARRRPRPLALPPAPPSPAAARAAPRAAAVSSLLSTEVRAQALSGELPPEHRQVTVAFVRFGGHGRAYRGEDPGCRGRASAHSWPMSSAPSMSARSASGVRRRRGRRQAHAHRRGAADAGRRHERCRWRCGGSSTGAAGCESASA